MTTQVSFRIDNDLKNDVEKTLAEMGLTLSSAITVFLTKVSREKCIPFEISADPFYSKNNIDHLVRIARRIEDGTANLSEHELIEVEDE